MIRPLDYIRHSIEMPTVLPGNHSNKEKNLQGFQNLEGFFTEKRLLQKATTTSTLPFPY